MNTQTRSRFLFLVNSGLVIMLLSGCATPAIKTVEVEADS